MQSGRGLPNEVDSYRVTVGLLSVPPLLFIEVVVVGGPPGVCAEPCCPDSVPDFFMSRLVICVRKREETYSIFSLASCLSTMGKVAMKSTQPLPIAHTCTVHTVTILPGLHKTHIHVW